jgi:heavy metal translocating P-type ATPase
MRSGTITKPQTEAGGGSGLEPRTHAGSPARAADGQAKSKSRLPHAKETYIAYLATAGILGHLALRYAFHAPALASTVPLYATLALGGLPLVFELARKMTKLEFGSDLLAGASILTSVALGEYLVGSIVVLMLSGGTALEQYASRRASSVLDALARRLPSAAHRKATGGVSDVALDDVAIGDTLVVFPHEVCPVDGAVVDGRGVMDEAYLTGEPFRMSKAPGAQVLSGAINGDTALTIVAEKLAVDSRYARIMRVVQESEQNRPQLRRLGDRLGAWYTPVAVGLAALSWFFSGDPRRFLAVMVVATPCPLLIAIPVAVIGAISLSARRAIIIKNPAVLEQVDTCQTLIFDKTGTLTYGRPSLTEVLCAPLFAREKVLKMAASLEIYSKHPLAGAIVSAANEAGVPLEAVTQIREKPGEGLRGIVDGHHVLITGRKHVEERRLDLPLVAAGLECLVFIDDVLAAAFRFRDAPRDESPSFVRHLSPSHRVSKVILLSGDRESEVRYLAESVGIEEVYFEKSPEEKVAIVKEESQQGRTLFVGDGINDAPGLLAATVGVAFGHNSDITAEAAGAVILEASLRKIDELIHIGRRMRRIALQSAIGGMGLSILGMIAAASGHLPPISGAVMQELIDLAAVLNALRVAMQPGDLTDF